MEMKLVKGALGEVYSGVKPDWSLLWVLSPLLNIIEETMSIIHFENNHIKIEILEEIEILKTASSKYLLNDVIAGQNDPIYKLLPTSVI